MVFLLVSNILRCFCRCLSPFKRFTHASCVCVQRRLNQRLTHSSGILHDRPSKTDTWKKDFLNATLNKWICFTKKLNIFITPTIQQRCILLLTFDLYPPHTMRFGQENHATKYFRLNTVEILSLAFLASGVLFHLQVFNTMFLLLFLLILCVHIAFSRQ